jgi:hypothetical protein
LHHPMWTGQCVNTSPKRAKASMVHARNKPFSFGR